MKIVFVLPDMPGGGSERVVAMLANEFVNRGYETAILLFAGNRVVYPLDKRIEVVVTGEESEGNIVIRMNRLINMRKFYKKNKGCYIFSFCVMGTVFSVLAAAGIQHRLLVSERSDPTKIEHQKLRNWAYGKAEKLVFQTEDMRDCFPKNIKKKAVVIPNAVPENMPAPYMGKRKKRIVTVGRLAEVKNHKLLIDAFKLFFREHPDYELHLFGVGELEEKLKKQVNVLGLDHKVIFRGFSNNVTEEIKDSMMFVLSSDYEGISNSMIEALGMGIPVISTDCPVGGSRLYIKNNINGILVPVGNREAMAEAMAKIADNSTFASELSSNAIKIREQYNLHKIADKFLKEAGI